MKETVLYNSRLKQIITGSPRARRCQICLIPLTKDKIMQPDKLNHIFLCLPGN